MGLLTDAAMAAAATGGARLKGLGRDRPYEEIVWEDFASALGIDSGDKGAMNEATYYTCTKILRETVGKLPFRLMRRMPNGGIETAYDHPKYNILCLRPNPYMSATTFWSAVEQSRINYGNAVVYMAPGRSADDWGSLWLIPDSELDVWWDNARALADVPDVYYRWSRGGEMTVLKSSEVMHFRWSDTVDGINGIPLRARLDRLLDGSLGSQDFQNSLIKKGLAGKAVMQYTANLNDASVEQMRKAMTDYANGTFKGGDVSIIPAPVGVTLQPLNTKLTDAQFEELKKYSAAQIAAAFGIKPQQINDMTKQSYASSQAQQEAFYQDTMLYSLRSYEDEITWKYLSHDELSRNYFVQADTTVMLRSDYETTVKANQAAVESGQITPNEGRFKLNLPALPDGDTLLCNGNMIPVSMAGTQYQAARRDVEGGEGDGK